MKNTKTIKEIRAIFSTVPVDNSPWYYDGTTFKKGQGTMGAPGRLWPEWVTLFMEHDIASVPIPSEGVWTYTAFSPNPPVKVTDLNDYVWPSVQLGRAENIPTCPVGPTYKVEYDEPHGVFTGRTRMIPEDDRPTKVR